MKSKQSILSIFIDESGDFGEYDYHSPYYIIGMVLHDQSQDISENIRALDNQLSLIDSPNRYIHLGPIIRKEKDYAFMDAVDRIKIVNRMMTFFRKTPVKYRTFYVEKRQATSPKQALNRLKYQISSFLKEYYQFFSKYDTVKIYYDNGQNEVKRMLSEVFLKELKKVEFVKIIPADYKLSQAADLVCTLTLTALKLSAKKLSASELLIFDDERSFKKQYLKRLEDKLFNGTM